MASSIYKLWLQAFIALVAFFLVATIYQETGDSVLLSQRARRLTELTAVEHRTDVMDEKLTDTLLRPLSYTITEPLIVINALWFASIVSCAFVLLYELPWWTQFTSTSLHMAAFMCLVPFVAIFVGAVFAFAVDGFLQYYERRVSRREHRELRHSDNRLIVGLAGSVIFVVGSAMTAVAGYAYVHLALPILGLFLLGYVVVILAIGFSILTGMLIRFYGIPRSFAIFTIALSTHTTLSETYGPHTSSAIAFLNCFQYLWLVWVPLVVPMLHDRFGFVPVGGFVTIISAILVVFPCILVFQVSQTALVKRSIE